MATRAEIRARLEGERERIQQRIASLSAELEEYAPAAQGESTYDNYPADVATDTFEEEQALGLRAHFAGELAEVEQALRRLETGQYGRCAECGEEIDAARLAAMPAARLCVRCQGRAEARHP